MLVGMDERLRVKSGCRSLAGFHIFGVSHFTHLSRPTPTLRHQMRVTFLRVSLKAALRPMRAAFVLLTSPVTAQTTSAPADHPECRRDSIGLSNMKMKIVRSNILVAGAVAALATLPLCAQDRH